MPLAIDQASRFKPSHRQIILSAVAMNDCGTSWVSEDLRAIPVDVNMKYQERESQETSSANREVVK